ncbi:MAG: VCBS domain-containing protein, partial [Parvularculales bacterium]
TLPDTDTDRDALEFKPVEGNQKSTTNGSFTISSEGNLVWTPTLSTFTGTEIFDVVIIDDKGGEKTKPVTITVNPALEATGGATKGVYAAYEDNPMRDPEGQLTFADPNRTGYDLHVKKASLQTAGTAITVDDTTVTLQYGTLTVDKNGYWAYELDNTNVAVNALDGDEDDNDGNLGSLTESITFTYSRADDPLTTNINEAASVSKTIDITINGATDKRGQQPPREYRDTTDDLSYMLFVDSYWSLTGGNGNDVIHGSNYSDGIYDRVGDDWIYTYGSDDSFYMNIGKGNDVYDGGTGDADSITFNKHPSYRTNSFAIQFKLNDETKWKFDPFTKSWLSNADSTSTNYGDFTFVRMWIDSNGNGLPDVDDEYNYLANIERMALFNASISNDVIEGGSRSDNIHGRGGDDVINGGGGDDGIHGGAGDDVVDGGGGIDTYHLSGWRAGSHYSLNINLEDNTRWKFNDDNDAWESGTTPDYTHFRIWHDLDDDGVEDTTDEFDYIINFEKLYVFVNGGNYNHIVGGSKGDRLDVDLQESNSILDGGDGQDTIRLNYNILGETFNAETTTRWRLDSDNIWTQVNSPSLNDYIRIWLDSNGNGEDDESDNYTYIRNFENYEIYAISNLGYDSTGSVGNDSLGGGGGNDTLSGRGGNDHIFGGRGDDLIFGGSGRNTLIGGEGDDYFAIYQGPHSIKMCNLNEVLDFSSANISEYYGGTNTESGDDKVRVYTDLGNETTLESLKLAANIRWTQNSDYNYDNVEGDRNYYNDSSLNDTIIYDTRGTDDKSDDVVLMVLQDFATLFTMAYFDVRKHPITVTGSDSAYEDNSLRDPSGQATLADTTLTGYSLIVGSTVIATDDTEITLDYGTLTVNQGGSWSYALDNGNTSVNTLDGGDRLSEWVTFYYSRLDNLSTTNVDESDTLSRTLEIKINGSTDVTTANNRTATEDLTYVSTHTSTTETLTVTGGSGDDVLTGSSGAEAFLGRDGKDRIDGGGGDDMFYICAGMGSDVVDGGAGTGDALYFNYDGEETNTSTKAVTFDLNDGTRWKYSASTQSWGSATSSNQNYATYKHVRIWVDSNGNGDEDTTDEYHYLTGIEEIAAFLGSTQDDVLDGGAGNDTIHGSGGDDVINGGGGDDHLGGGNGDDEIDGGSGSNTYISHYGARSSDPYTIHINLGDKTLYKKDTDGDWDDGSASDGHTHVKVWYDLGSNGNVDTTDEFDYITNIQKLAIVGGSGNDRLTGGADNDDLDGGAGSDNLNGGAGDDTLAGGAGRDLLIGGKGNDTFVLNLDGVLGDLDDIRDFSSGTTSGNHRYNTKTKGGNDKIEVEVSGGLAALQARIDAGTSTDLLDALEDILDIDVSVERFNYSAINLKGDGKNEGSDNDTVIYDTSGATNVALVVVQDYTLAFEDFSIVEPEVA